MPCGRRSLTQFCSVGSRSMKRLLLRIRSSPRSSCWAGLPLPRPNVAAVRRRRPPARQAASSWTWRPPAHSQRDHPTDLQGHDALGRTARIPGGIAFQSAAKWHPIPLRPTRSNSDLPLGQRRYQHLAAPQSLPARTSPPCNASTIRWDRRLPCSPPRQPRRRCPPRPIRPLVGPRSPHPSRRRPRPAAMSVWPCRPSRPYQIGDSVPITSGAVTSAAMNSLTPQPMAAREPVSPMVDPFGGSKDAAPPVAAANNFPLQPPTTIPDNFRPNPCRPLRPIPRRTIAASPCPRRPASRRRWARSPSRPRPWDQRPVRPAKEPVPLGRAIGRPPSPATDDPEVLRAGNPGGTPREVPDQISQRRSCHRPECRNPR